MRSNRIEIQCVKYYHPLRLSILPKLTYFISEVPFSYGSVSFYHRFLHLLCDCNAFGCIFALLLCVGRYVSQLWLLHDTDWYVLLCDPAVQMTSRVVQSTEQICANLPATV